MGGPDGEGGLETVRNFWTNQIKEASVIRYGTPKAIMDLSKEDTTTLWKSLEKYNRDSYTAFWKILDSQFPPKKSPISKFIIPGQDTGNRNVGPDGVQDMMSSMVIKETETDIKTHSNNLLKIPLKVYLPTSNLSIPIFLNPYYVESSKSIGKPVGSKPKTYLIHTAGTALNLKFPDLFPSKRTCILARPMMHGIEIPMGAPLLELLQEASYPDGFLHLSIVMMS